MDEQDIEDIAEKVFSALKIAFCNVTFGHTYERQNKFGDYLDLIPLKIDELGLEVLDTKLKIHYQRVDGVFMTANGMAKLYGFEAGLGLLNDDDIDEISSRAGNKFFEHRQLGL